MTDALLAPLSDGVTRRALAELVLVGAICGPLGVWVLAFRQSYAAESLAHGLLPGVVIAALLGVPVGIGAIGGALLAALAIAVAARQPRVGTDAGVAVAVTSLFGVGGVLALAPAAPPRLEELLFGDLLAVTAADLAVAAAGMALVLGGLFLTHRSLVLSAFDAASARSLGARPRRAEVALLGMLALTVAVGSRALGNLLVVALLIAPALAARRLSSSLRGSLASSALIAVLAGVGGLYLSYYLGVAAGAAVALCALAPAVAALSAGRG